MIEKIIIIALIVQAIHYSMQKGEIFGWLGDWCDYILPQEIHKPIFDCAVCMTPWYGSIIYFILWRYHGISFFAVVLAATGLNVVLNVLMRETID